MFVSQLESPLQSSHPRLQTQCPLLQCELIPHMLPQEPQLLLSISLFVSQLRLLSQSKYAALQTQCPLLHCVCGPHALPQEPQLLGSSFIFTHAPAHKALPVPQ